MESSEAQRRLDSFLISILDRYDVGRNDTDDGAASGLSPWIHFVTLSPYEMSAVMWVLEGWTPATWMKTPQDEAQGQAGGAFPPVQRHSLIS